MQRIISPGLEILLIVGQLPYWNEPKWKGVIKGVINEKH